MRVSILQYHQPLFLATAREISPTGPVACAKLTARGCSIGTGCTFIPTRCRLTWYRARRPSAGRPFLGPRRTSRWACLSALLAAVVETRWAKRATCLDAHPPVDGGRTRLRTHSPKAMALPALHYLPHHTPPIRVPDISDVVKRGNIGGGSSPTQDRGSCGEGRTATHAGGRDARQPRCRRRGHRICYPPLLLF